VGLTETCGPGKGVKNEAKAAAGVAKVNSLGMGRDDGTTV